MILVDYPVITKYFDYLTSLCVDDVICFHTFFEYGVIHELRDLTRCKFIQIAYIISINDSK